VNFNRSRIETLTITDVIAEEKGNTHNVRAVTRALTVLKSFVGKDGQTLAEVTVATGLDKGTTRRLLLTLMDNGFVTHDARVQQYRLGLAIRELAASVTGEFDLKALALPVLNDIASEFHMTAFLSVYDKGDAVCLARVHDMRGIEVHWWAIGGTLPFNCGGAPKLLLAYRPESEIAKAMKRPMVALTPKSITDPAKLEADLARIRKRGWELAVDDVALGLTALAVPVKDSQGNVVCSVSVAGLTPQMASRGRPAYLDRLLSAAAELERRLKASTMTRLDVAG
jgi:DNA-binding IclR family transcriptional regulator